MYEVMSRGAVTWTIEEHTLFAQVYYDWGSENEARLVEMVWELRARLLPLIHSAVAVFQAMYRLKKKRLPPRTGVKSLLNRSCGQRHDPPASCNTQNPFVVRSSRSHHSSHIFTSVQPLNRTTSIEVCNCPALSGIHNAKMPATVVTGCNRTVTGL